MAYERPNHVEITARVWTAACWCTRNDHAKQDLARVTHVVCVDDEYSTPSFLRESRMCCWIPMEDKHGFDIIGQQAELTGFVQKALSKSRDSVVLFHCAAGINRSVASAIAFEAKRLSQKASVLIDRARAQDKCVLTNLGFEGALRERFG